MADDGSHFDGLSSLVRLSGATVPARARFVGEGLIMASFSSITMGLVCGQVGAVFMLTTGPIVPFLVGSWAGYTFGLAGYWRSSKKYYEMVATRYPKLLVHSLKCQTFSLEVPPTLVGNNAQVDEQGTQLKQWIAAGGLGRLSLGILAAQACRSDVEEIERGERQRLTEEYQEPVHPSDESY